ncbi:MAG: hypothetical protein HY763_03715 [Planctomycetes bacterium]|nr:hypothetical protein [Planctomycetota bacterium]
MTEGVLKFAACSAILATGVGVAGYYAWKQAAGGRGAVGPLDGDRPWRRLGAGICLVLAVMFVLGVYVVDIPDRPRVYATYWLVMLLLVMWLCVLATKDIWYTRELILRRRQQRHAGRGGAESGPGADRSDAG